MESNIWLRAICMENCQSHKNTVFEFVKDKLNVVVADNSVGKSVFFKMLYATAYPKKHDREDRLNLIRHGADYACIKYIFSDNSRAVTCVYPAGIIYYFAENKSDFIQYKEPPEILLNNLGLLLDKNVKYVVNIIDGEQDMLLVNNDPKSNHNLLRLITENQELQTLLNKLPDKIKDFSELELQAKNQYSFIHAQLSKLEYTDTEKMETEINRLELLHTVLGMLVGIVQDITGISNQVQNKKDYTKLQCMVHKLELLNSIDVSLTNITTVVPINEKALKLCEYITYINNIRNCIVCIKIQPFNPQLLQLSELIESLYNNLNTLTVLQTDKSQSYLEKLNRIEEILCIQKLICEISFLNKSNVESENCINTILNELAAQKALFDCGLHGKVVFDGKKCIPV